jgi:uncharacterized membrane protein
MDIQSILSVVFRWMHMLAAITAVGGTIFMRLALLPALAKLPEETRKTLHEDLRSNWAKPVRWSIMFLIVSGLYNIIFDIGATYDLSKVLFHGVKYYHAVFGIKVLLAIAIFFIASALTGHTPAFQKIRDNRRFWLTLNMALAIVLVCLSGILRKSDPPKKPAQLTSASSSGLTDLAKPQADANRNEVSSPFLVYPLPPTPSIRHRNGLC